MFYFFPLWMWNIVNEKTRRLASKLICGKKRYSLNRNYSQTILRLNFSVSAINRQISCYGHWIDRISHLHWGNNPVFMMSPLTSTYFRIINLNVFLKFSCQDSMYNNPEQPWRLFISKMFIISSYSIIYVQTWPKRETAHEKSLAPRVVIEYIVGESVNVFHQCTWHEKTNLSTRLCLWRAQFQVLAHWSSLVISEEPSVDWFGKV